jgi:predicted O-linked N-acetylglucosamine transferase (SPINDLY family)
MAGSLGREGYTSVAVSMRQFFKNIRTLASGGEGPGYDVPLPRIFKYAQGTRFVSFNPVSVVSPGNVPLQNIRPLIRSADIGVWGLRYAWLTEKQVYQRLVHWQYIQKRDFLEKWYRSVWIPWSEKTRDSIESVSSVHPIASGATTRFFEQAHPRSVEKRFGQADAQIPDFEVIEKKFEDAIECHQKGDLSWAEELYRAVLLANPGHANARYLLGKVKAVQNKTVEAIGCFRRAAALSPANPDFGLSLAGELQKARAFDEAAVQYKRVISLKPDSAEAYVRLGDLFRTVASFKGAERSYRMALRFDARNVQAYNNLGTILRMNGRYTEAIQCYRQALHFKPSGLEPAAGELRKNNLQSVKTLNDADMRKMARNSHVEAKILNNLALTLTDQGNIEEAEKVYRQALTIEPSYAELRSNLLFCLCYKPELEYARLFEEHMEFGRIHGGQVLQSLKSTETDANAYRKLRVGFVSADFRAHSVSYFFEPLLENLDRTNIEILCYSQVGFEDAVTQRLKGQADLWRDITGCDDEAAVKAIRDDHCDILIDLSGHTGGNRLPVFAQKAAPLQVTWLGYPNTTGLSEVDFRITDSAADPAGEDVFYSERLVRLGGCFLCYRPPADAPDVEDARRSYDGVVLGSFCTLPKLNPRVVALWSRILLSQPDARLVLKRMALDDPGTQERLMGMFHRNGIDIGRIELAGHAPSLKEHLEYYSRIDICLDTFPYNGTTTTCEALWMGVPVVTLSGKHHVQRVSASLLHAIGLDELAAQNEDEYAGLVCALARNERRRHEIRAGLRARMQSSGLCDGPAFAKKFEKAIREMWGCSGK